MVRNILNMAFYQKIYLDKIPDYAIINEAVNLTKEKNKRYSGLVNAVLRNLMRQSIPEIDIEDEVEKLALIFSSIMVS